MWEGSVEVAMRRCRGSFSGGKRRHGGAMRRAVTIRIGRLGDVCDIVTTHHPGSARSSHRSPPRGSRCRRGWPWCPRVSRGITKRDEPLPRPVPSRLHGASHANAALHAVNASFSTSNTATPRRDTRYPRLHRAHGCVAGGHRVAGETLHSRDIKFWRRALRYSRRFFWQELAWVESTPVRVYDG